MNRLERFFRSVYDQSPPPGSIDPPAGGWEDVQRRLASDRSSARPSAGPWLAGGLLLLCVLGFAIAGYERETEATGTRSPVPAQPYIAPPPVAVRQATGSPVPASPLKAPTDPLSGAVAPPVDSAAARRAVPPPVRTPPPSGPAAEPAPDPVVPPEPAAVAAVTRTWRTDPLDLPPLPDAVGEPGGWWTDLTPPVELPAPVPVAKEPWRFVAPLRTEPAPAVWEVSARALPWRIRGYGHYERFSTTPNGAGDYRAFTQRNGPPLILYSTGDGNTSIHDPRMEIAMAGIEVARRFSSGFRLSVGAVYNKDGRRIDDSSLDYAREVGSGKYLLFHVDSEDWYAHWITLGAQYTINRRRRFRINLGLQLLGQVYAHTGRRSFLVGGEPVSVQPVSASEMDNHNFFGVFLPMPQVTFEYQLRSHWSLSAGIGGMSGVGATYRIR